MAATNTNTQTETFSRIFGIKNQFKIAFKRMMGYTDVQCQPFLDAIKEKVIDYITFWTYSYDSFGNKEKWCELILYVDWALHKQFLLEGKNEILLKKSWNESVPEVDVAIGMIEDAISEFNLIPTFSVGFYRNISDYDYNYYMKKLNLVSGTTVKWKSGMKSVYKKVPKELPEMCAEVKIADNLL